MIYKVEETADPSSHSSSQKKFQPQYIEKIRHFLVKQNLSDIYISTNPALQQILKWKCKPKEVSYIQENQGNKLSQTI